SYGPYISLQWPQLPVDGCSWKRCKRNSCVMKLNSLTLFFVLTSACLSYGQDIKHSFFIAGPKFTGIIGENGEEVWNSGKPGARDGYVLQNGNVLVCWADEVVEFDKDKKPVFTYKRSVPEMELGTAVRLENGNTMITESGKSPRLVEVDSKGNVKISV